jgi:hypothetical protein
MAYSASLNSPIISTSRLILRVVSILMPRFWENVFVWLWIIKLMKLMFGWWKNMVLEIVGVNFLLWLNRVSIFIWNLWGLYVIRSSDRSKVLLVTNHASNLYVLPRKLFWYDLKSEQLTYVQGIPTFNQVMICAESLVSPFLPIDCSTSWDEKAHTRDGMHISWFQWFHHMISFLIEKWCLDIKILISNTIKNKRDKDKHICITYYGVCILMSK